MQKFLSTPVHPGARQALMAFRVAEAPGDGSGLSRDDRLGSVEIHRELMTAAARWIIAWKLWSVLSARMAMRLNSLSLQKKFSIR